MYLADQIWQWLWDTNHLERRPAQIELALEIRRTLHHTPPAVGLFESPTGSGKTLVQLVEGLAFARQVHKPVWIATPRRDLQTQLKREAALLTTATRALGLPLPTIANIQGLEHTLCHHIVSHQEPDLQAAIHTWLTTHPDGELDQLPNHIPRSSVSMTAVGCLGERCASYQSCLGLQPRLHAQEQELVITNHAVIAGTIRHPFVPAPAILMLDEAHLFDRAIRNTLTFSVSLHEISRHAQAFLRVLPNTKSQRVGTARTALDALVTTLRSAHINLTDGVSRTPNTILPLFGYGIPNHPLAPKAVHNAKTILESLRTVLKSFTPLAKDTHIAQSRLDIARQELGQAEQNLEAFCQGTRDQYFLVRTDSQALGFLRIPDAISWYTRKRLWESLDHAILLSGTLATSNADPFAAIRGTLGIPGEAPGTKQLMAQTHTTVERVFPPSWTPDLRINVVHQTFPSVFVQNANVDEDNVDTQEEDLIINPDWLDLTAQQILEQDRTQAHGIVVLSTSYAMQEAILARIQSTLSRPAAIQQKGQMSVAVQTYLSLGPRAIFFTIAGRDGMDLPNAYIQDLFILKLPYQSKAKTAIPDIADHSQGLLRSHRPGSSQYYVQIQRPAIVNFRQAIGRVIRQPHDQGTVWVMDRRLADPGHQSLFFGGALRRYLYPSTIVTILPALTTTEAA